MNRERAVQQVRWFGIAFASAMTKSIVHFYPSTSGVSAPYNVICRVSIFGSNFEKKTVALEGARLSQPDGVRLEEIFPGLGDTASGIFGVEFEISSNQPRVDLTRSWCIVECAHGAHGLRYVVPQLPTAPSAEGADTRVLAGLALKDALNVTSVVVMNVGGESQQPELFVQRPSAEGPAAEDALTFDPVRPLHAVELPLQDDLYASVKPQEWPFGLVRSRGLYARLNSRSTLRYFLIARDAVTKRPVSILPLGEAQ